MKNRIKNYFFLLVTSVLSAVLHNAFYGVFKIEEPIFFFLTFIFLGWMIVLFFKDLISLFWKK